MAIIMGHHCHDYIAVPEGATVAPVALCAFCLYEVLHAWYITHRQSHTVK